MSYTLDASFVDPFVSGAINTLKVQCSLEAKMGKLYLKDKKAEGAPKIDIAGIIGVTSKAFNGSIALCFPEKTFLGVMGKMLGETFETINKDLEDGAAELTNIIFGEAKRVLNEKGHTIQKALPSVATGWGLKINHLSQRPALIIPFETEVGSFHIEVGIDPI